MKSVVLWILRGYKRFISPMLPPACRFYPSCSVYAMGAIERHGLLRGGFLALKRILKCHPFHPGGYDPVPPTADEKDHHHDNCDHTISLEDV